MTVVLMPRMQTSRAYEFMGVNPPSFPSIQSCQVEVVEFLESFP